MELLRRRRIQKLILDGRVLFLILSFVFAVLGSITAPVRAPLTPNDTQAPPLVVQWSPRNTDEGAIEWNQTYGRGLSAWGGWVEQTEDGGYILTGITFSYESGNLDVWLIKTDENGHAEWNQTYGGPGREEGGSGAQTVDGGYLLTGWTESYGAGGTDVWLIKTDENGHAEWNQTYGGPDEDMGRWGAQTADGGYLLTGSTSSYGTGGADVWLIKVSGTGAVTSPAVTETEPTTTSSVVSEVPGGPVFWVLVVLGFVFVRRGDFAKRKR